MFKRLLLPAIAVLSASFFTSCDNDLDVTADYKEIGVLYSLINPSDSVHLFRIQKAFLGEGNALVMAQNPDSTYYPDILDVKLERVKDGSVIGAPIQLTRFVGPDKEEGEFPKSPNILYRTNGEYLYRDSEYRITIVNTQTGYTFKSQTPIVDTVRIVKPSITNNSAVSWVTTVTPSDTVFNNYPVEYAIPDLARIHNLTIRFKFKEKLNGVETIKTIDWNFGNEYVNVQSGSNIQKSIDGESFYRFVEQKLNPVSGMVREAISLDFVVSAGSEVLANYININSSTTSVLSSIPYYSNVENGTGIFASRFVTVSPNKVMSANSLIYLKEGKYTKSLGFQ